MKMPNSAQKPTALISQGRAIRTNRPPPPPATLSAGKLTHKRASEVVNASLLNMHLPAIQQIALKSSAGKRSKSKGKSGNKSTSIGKSGSKENAVGGLRMRKVFMNGKLSTGGTPSHVPRPDSMMEACTHNLLVDRKEMKI